LRRQAYDDPTPNVNTAARTPQRHSIPITQFENASRPADNRAIMKSLHAILWATVLIGVAWLAAGRVVRGADPATQPATTHPAMTWANVHSFLYQLQNIDPARIAASHFDAVVIDYSGDAAEGADGKPFTPEQVHLMQNGPGGPKKVLAYLSIGEAEDYRFYWKSTWDKKNAGKPGTANPSWLGPEDPDWKGNYKVKYWDPAWQAIIKQYVDKIVAAGFDGMYLDIIDAYEFWGPDGDGKLNRASAEQEMVDFVEETARYARVDKGRPDFAVFPQNCPELGVHADYMKVVTGIGAEDTWYDGNKANKAADIRDTLADLDRFKAAGKVVLVIDYVTQKPLIDDFYTKARARGYIPYASDRELDKLTINAGHDPQ
jgi:cysteinyl-tRNA synthetase